MVTLGVDLASQAKRTAVCLIRWDGESADVDCLRTDVTDSDLLDLFGRPGQGPDKIAIDAPFGWPEDFVRAIHTYSTSTVWPSGDDSHLRLRRTDRVVREKTDLVPLAVAADRIAMTAMRAARLLARVAGDGEAIDRSGDGRFVEVYPAAALRTWGLPWKGYKGPGPEKRKKRAEIVAGLAEKAASWLTRSEEVRCRCRESDDMLDALVAALVARAAAIGWCEPIPDEDSGLAEKEGWIALPQSDSLARLTTIRPDS